MESARTAYFTELKKEIEKDGKGAFMRIFSNPFQNPAIVPVTAEVTNTGSRFSGREVVQVYYSAPRGRLEKPYQELAAYGKTKELAPGEAQELTLTYTVTDMA